MFFIVLLFTFSTHPSASNFCANKNKKEKKGKILLEIFISFIYLHCKLTMANIAGK